MPHPERKRVELLQEALCVDLPMPIDPTVLRLGFRGLCDRAAAGFLRLGCDFDDVELERSLICRTSVGGEFEVSDPPLSDGDRLSLAIAQRWSLMTDPENASADIRIVELRVLVWREGPPR